MKNSNLLVFTFQPSFLRLLCLVAVLLFGAALPGWAADSSWDEEAGGDFDTGGNWTDGVPGDGDIATFDLNETYTVEFGSPTTTNLRVLVLNGMVTFDLDENTYALTATGTTTFPALTDALIVQGGSGQSASLTITGGGILQTLNASTSSVNNARIGRVSGGSGSLTVDDATWENAGRIIMGTSNSTSALTVQNGGIVESTGRISLQVSASNTITVTGGGSVLDIAELQFIGGGNNTVLIEAGGQLLVGSNTAVNSGSTMTVTGNDTVWNGDTATRTVSVAGGALTISDGVTSNLALSSMNGSFTLSGGTVFGRSGTNLAIESTASSILTITGSGTEFTAGTISFRGNDSNTNNEHRITLSGGAVLTGSTLSGASAGRTGSEILITGANTVANFTAGVSLAIGEGSTQFLTVSDGGTLNTVNFYVGLAGYAEAEVDGGTANVSSNFFIGRFADGEGILNVTNGGVLTSPSISVGREGIGTLTISGGSNLTNTSNSFVGELAGSSGSVTVSGSSSWWAVENSTLTVGGAGTGILTLEEGGFVSASDGAVVIGVNGTLAGDGTVFSPTVTNAGLVSPGNSTGILTLSGNYIQEATGTLEIGIGGTTPGSGHDQLSNWIFETTATLEGTLTLLAVDDFMPSIGDSFVILDFVASGGSIFGEFDTINAFTLTSGRFWDFDNLYTTGTVSVIPEPATVAFLLGAFALAGVVWRRRRLRNA